MGRIRVAFVDQAVAFGGSLICISHLIRRMDRERFEAMVVAEMPDSVLHHHLPGISIFKLHHPVSYTDWQRVNGWARRIASAPLRRLLLRVLGLGRTLANLSYALRLAALLRRERVGIVHINNGMENEEAHLAALLTGTRCVAHEHFESEMNAVRRWYARRVARFVAISEYIAGEMIGRGIPAEKIEVVPNPVPESALGLAPVDALRARFGIAPGEKAFGMVSRLVRWKGHPKFIAAAAEVLRAVPGARAVIVGDVADGRPEYREELARLIAATGMAGRFVMTGYLQETDAIYGLLQVMVHASVEPEPFGLVITEAMVHGVAVVASRFGAAPEIIEDGIEGLIVDPNDTDALAGAIVSLLTDDRRRRRMGMLARRKVLEQHDAGRYARRMELLYEGAMRGRRGGGRRADAPTPEAGGADRAGRRNATGADMPTHRNASVRCEMAELGSGRRGAGPVSGRGR